MKTLYKLTSTILMLLALSVGLSQPALATLEIELTQGIEGAVPIAVVPFGGQQKKMASNELNFADTIGMDLKNSGRFKVLARDDLRKFPIKADDVSLKHWRKKQVDYVITGRVTVAEVADNPQHTQYQVHVDLVDLYPEQSANDKATTAVTVLSKDYVVEAPAFRRLAHRMADEIYTHITGERGIFSTRIAYVLMKHRHNKPYQYQLQIADIDGHNAKTLLTSKEPIMSPTWAPDAKRIAYVSFEQERSEVYVQNIETGTREKIASFSGINSAPAWSPDGKKMAVVLSRTGKPKIFVMDLTSRSFTQVTTGMSIDTEPTWMPDGQSILFTSNRGGGPQIYRVSLATRGVERVTFDGRYNASVDVSADGKTISYLHIDGRRFAIAAQNMTTGFMHTLTKTKSGLDESPSISPNGRMIVYATHDRGQGILGMVSVDGRIRLRLPAHDGNVQEPAWSPYIG